MKPVWFHRFIYSNVDPPSDSSSFPPLSRQAQPVTLDYALFLLVFPFFSSQSSGIETASCLLPFGIRVVGTPSTPPRIFHVLLLTVAFSTETSGVSPLISSLQVLTLIIFFSLKYEVEEWWLNSTLSLIYTPSIVLHSFYPAYVRYPHFSCVKKWRRLDFLQKGSSVLVYTLFFPFRFLLFFSPWSPFLKPL